MNVFQYIVIVLPGILVIHLLNMIVLTLPDYIMNLRWPLLTHIDMLWTAGGRLTSTATSSAVLINSTVSFNCASSTRIRWKFYKLGSSEPELVYTGFKLHPNVTSRYRVDSDLSLNSNSLVISEVQPNDSGSYECMAINTTKYNIRFKLVVLGKENVPVIDFIVCSNCWMLSK